MVHSEDGERVPDWRRKLGQAGVWVSGPAVDEDPGGFARFVEQLGYTGLWVGGGNPDHAAFSRLEALLGATERLVVVTGIANIWAWDPGELATAARRLSITGPDRFVLGLGVSHAPLVGRLGRRYERPYTRMVHFLDELDQLGGASVPRLLAALGPRMLQLAAARSGGAHPYLTVPEHTSDARATLGASPLLAPEQALVLDDDPVVARRRARAYLERYLRLPNYTDNLRRYGWQTADFEGGGSDALVDALVVHGTADVAVAGVAAHLSAGADHVCVQALAEDGGVDRPGLERLAAALTAG